MKNKTAVLALIILMMVSVLGCNRLSEFVNNRIQTDDTTNTGKSDSGTFTLNAKEWSSYSLENMDVTIELPGKPSDKTPPLPPSYRAIFSAMNIQAFDEKDFQSSVTQLVPTGARKFKIKELADTNMAAVKRQIPDLVYSVDITSEANAKLNGSFTKNGKNYELRGCCIYKKSKPERVWAVLTLFPKDNADGQTASLRMINSVTFKDSAEECK